MIRRKIGGLKPAVQGIANTNFELALELRKQSSVVMVSKITPR